MNRASRFSARRCALLPPAVVLSLAIAASGLVAAPTDSTFISSNLPIVVIDTRGQVIVSEPKITAGMGIIDNGAGARNFLTDLFNDYSGPVGIEIRGSSSQMFPKKQYAVETRNAAGQDTAVSLLGLPPESDWVLSAPYSDKSLVRDALAYMLARKLGRYASRARFCEVVLNGEYQGVYVLFEKIKRDKSRVGISKLTEADTTGDGLTGGYIIKIDKLDGAETEGWYSTFAPYPNAWQKVHYQHHYPAFEDLVFTQRAYIQRFVYLFERAMSLPTYADSSLGYPHFIDVMSFVDGVLLSELGKNVDAYRLSAFFHKDRDSKGGRLVMGPLWDFNHAFGNSDYYDGAVTEGFQLDYLASDAEFHSDDWWQPPFWWKRLVDEAGFAAAMRHRWMEIRGGALSDASIAAAIDSLTGMLSEAQARNFDRWRILGTYVWPNAHVAQTYAGEVQYLKQWVSNRLVWLDGAFSPDAVEPGEDQTGLPGSLVLEQNYPNPFNSGSDIIYRLPEGGRVRLALYDLVGRLVRILVEEEVPAGRHRARLDAVDLSSGVYVYRLQFVPTGGVAGARARSGGWGQALSKRLVLVR